MKVTYIRNKNLIFRKSKGLYIVFNPEKGIFYSLNNTASILWKKLWKQSTVRELTDTLHKNYGNSKATKEINTDTKAFLAKAKKNNLVKLTN